MKFEFKPSFERSIKSLPSSEQTDVKEAALNLIDVLSQEKQIHQGLGLKRLTREFWEVHKGIKTRILFRWTGDLVEFVLAGNHDDVRRFLKSI
jgi:mRNA-degrading endonuclease YafQ of YafQ-DinJ toxin-antitoxin module